jgi:erythromycin esterase
MTTRPVPVPDLIADVAADADIVGLGTSAREAHELFRLVEQTTRQLLDRGFGTIAVLDNQRVGELYDRYLTGADVDIDRALAQAWGPWQIDEMRQALTALREHNRRHPHRPIRIVALGQAGALPADYDRVVELVTAIDPSAAAAVREPLDVIRVAHDAGEHVLRANGTHPGTPFVDLGPGAPGAGGRGGGHPERTEARRLLDLIVDYHANAIGVGYDHDRAEMAAATQLLDHYRRTGDRIVLWEGTAHVAAHGAATLGSHLRRALGDRYVAAHLTFGEGKTPRHDIPPARAGSIEGTLATAGGVQAYDLRTAPPAELAELLDAPCWTRLISGLYDPAKDHEHYYELPSLRASFDVIAFTPTITPVRPVSAG